jgi:alkylation response protein AidB-like acyl-CoA dehydrogenase
MDFSFTPDQELLRETARTLLARECPTALLRAHITDVAAADLLWSHVREFSALGTGPTVDLCVFMEELGAVAAPGPFFASAVLGAPVLAALGADLLAEVETGRATVTLAVAGSDGRWRPNDEPRKTFVPEAETVDTVLAVNGDGTVVALDAPEMRRLETIDTTRPLYDVETAAGGTALGTLDPETFDRVLGRATVALAAELVGTARHLLEMTLEYAKHRHQFGVPIGSFQAVQHKLADMSLDVERAWSEVYYAAMTVDADDADRPRAVHAAKAAANEAGRRCAKDGIQIHGGIGYTWEHDLHLFMRRAFATEALLGTTGWHHDRIADLLFT